ncbi:DgyrCDS984 [Dimorphilus gyrociliatus]|uniref:DgyrCDS984 n=1 Tax=Dimorphilus gyrociliatus TaxID=2664684 RepID=A0A7I8VAY1_9ANNE|nr:DgyrCDS984 [Dimorphilus gyrociliatus]
MYRCLTALFIIGISRVAVPLSIELLKPTIYSDLRYESTVYPFLTGKARSFLECNVICGNEERCSKGSFHYGTNDCLLYETDPTKVPDQLFNNWKSFVSNKADWGFIRHGFRLASHTELFGRAEIKINNKWGTICDDSVVPSGWPTAFCRLMGYSHSNESFFAENYYVINNKPIHLHNLACFGSLINLDKFTEECSVSPTVPCTHAKDIFIRCVK